MPLVGDPKTQPRFEVPGEAVPLRFRLRDPLTSRTRAAVIALNAWQRALDEDIAEPDAAWVWAVDAQTGRHRIRIFFPVFSEYMVTVWEQAEVFSRRDVIAAVAQTALMAGAWDVASHPERSSASCSMLARARAFLDEYALMSGENSSDLRITNAYDIYVSLQH